MSENGTGIQSSSRRSRSRSKSRSSAGINLKINSDLEMKIKELETPFNQKWNLQLQLDSNSLKSVSKKLEKQSR